MLDHYAAGLFLAWGAYAMGILSPGPNVLAVMGTSMAEGRRAGATLALGMISGTFLWGSLTLFGLTAVLSLYASFMTLLKLVGAAYLLWLAVKAFRSAASSAGMATRSLGAGRGMAALYRRGLAIQMSNPKAALTWIAIMSLAVDEAAPLWVGALVVAGAAVISTVGHLAYAYFFSTAPVVALYHRARRGLDAALGVFFCFASVKLATSRL